MTSDEMEKEYAEAGGADLMLEQIEETDGMEVPKPLWPFADALVAAGKITLSSARGPDGMWKRAELAENTAD